MSTFHWPGTWLHATESTTEPRIIEIEIVQRGHRETVVLDERTLRALAEHGYEILVTLRADREEGEGRDRDITTPDADSAMARYLTALARRM